MRTCHCNSIMITNYFDTHHRNRFWLSRIYFTRHYWWTRFIEGSISSPYPALGPEPKNLISFAIFIKQTAVVLSVPEKFTISSCAAKAANLLVEGLNGIFVILLISLTIFLSKFLLYLILFQPLYHLVLNNKFPLMLLQF